MKKGFLIAFLVTAHLAFAGSLPVFSIQPTNKTVSPGSMAMLNASATGATSYQWIFNGTNIPGATGASLPIANVQTANVGYYVAMAVNATGQVPSQMAYLSLDYTYGGTVPSGAGTLPFSNVNDTYNWGLVEDTDGQVPANGTVQIVAGRQLDQMVPLGAIVRYGIHPSTVYTNGYYNNSDQSAPTLAPGEMVYYSVVANSTNSGTPYTEPSTVMFLNAGTNGFAAPPAYGLEFPPYLEWPNPKLSYLYSTNQIRVTGETVSFYNLYSAIFDSVDPPPDHSMA